MYLISLTMSLHMIDQTSHGSLSLCRVVERPPMDMGLFFPCSSDQARPSPN